MTITIDGTDYRLPATLMDVTLADRIEYDVQYGKELKERLAKISDMKDGIDKDMDFTEYQLDVACKTLSFFGKIPLDIVRNTSVQDVLIVYESVMKYMSEDTNFAELEFALNHSFEWNEATWVIAPPELKQGSTTTFGEFLDAKQAVKNLWELGQDKWGAMLTLACVYFRKQGEAYHESLSYEGSDRYDLMKTLPLEYALHIGFFLNASISGYMRTFPSLPQPEILPDLN